MRGALAALLVCTALAGETLKPLPPEDGIRIREFYRLAAQIQDEIWPDWSKTPDPLLLVTQDTEYLTHWPNPPQNFQKVGEDVYARPRQFPTNLLATFPAFGPPAVIVIGEPASTTSNTSTPWLFTLMHEHFHQLQYRQPGYYSAVEALGLSHGDKTGMWMLNYPFPYDKPEVARSFGSLRDSLVAALKESDQQKFNSLAGRYLQQRKEFFAQLSSDDHKYFSFQLWQEGVARYTQIKAAEAAAAYKPTAECMVLSDYTPFGEYARVAPSQTLDELTRIDITKAKRDVVYSFGAAEAMLLDRINPRWKAQYFQHPLTTDPLF